VKAEKLGYGKGAFSRKPPRPLPKWHPCLRISVVRFSTIGMPPVTPAEGYDRMTKERPIIAS
jgi:hypothetical protein